MLLQSNLAVTLCGPPHEFALLVPAPDLCIAAAIGPKPPPPRQDQQHRWDEEKCILQMHGWSLSIHQPALQPGGVGGVGGWVVIVLQVPQPARGAQRKIWVCLRATRLLARCFFPPYVTLIWSEICSGFILLAWDSGSCL